MIEKFNSVVKGVRSSGEGEKGFTLIELMIVVAIIGILAAIAIPQFATYRMKAYDAAAKSDLSNLASQMENYFLDNNTYTTTLPTGFSASQSVTVTITSIDISAFTATAKHAASTNTWSYVSNAGGLQ